MTTRFNAVDQNNYGVPGVKSGYDGVRSDFSIPPCGIEDVDVGLFKLFDKEIAPMVGGKDTADFKKVPVIFAAGEKWAMLKNGVPLRDKTNTLILPLITIMRTSVTQGAEDFAGRGINQQTGEIVVRRRLDSSDRDYQNLINKLFVLNQTNVAVGQENQTFEQQATTYRAVGKLKNSFFVNSGALLQSSRKDNVFETIVVPSPQFYTATYEIDIWTQYTQHMNQIIEKLMSSFLPQAQAWKITTEKGYWFVATIDGGNFGIETNFEDMSSAERFIKCKISLKVPAYIWASNAPGVPIPVKRYVSSPIIDFSTSVGAPSGSLSANVTEQDAEFQNTYILGSDDPTLPLDNRPNAKEDQRRPGWRQQVVTPSNSIEAVDPNDPTNNNLPRGYQKNIYKKVAIGNEVKYARIISQNPTTGETVYSEANLEGLSIIPVKSI